MTLIFALNTTFPTREMLLFDLEKGDTLIRETWEDRRDDEKQILEKFRSLTKYIKSRALISGIVLVNGPGSFAAMRSAVVFANTLSFALTAQKKEKVGIFVLSTFEFLRLKFKAPLQIILHAGGQHVALQRKTNSDNTEPEIITFDEALNTLDPNKPLAAILPTPRMESLKESNVKLLNMQAGKSLKEILKEILSQIKNTSSDYFQTWVDVNYLRPPHITLSKKNLTPKK